MHMQGQGMSAVTQDLGVVLYGSTAVLAQCSVVVKKAHCMLGTVGEGTEEGAVGSQEPVLQRCPLFPTPLKAAAFGHRCRQAAGLSIAELPWALPPFAQPRGPRHRTVSTHIPSVCCVPAPQWGGGVVTPGSFRLSSLPGILLLAHFYLPDEVSVCPRHCSHAPLLPTPGEPMPIGGHASLRAAGTCG